MSKLPTEKTLWLVKSGALEALKILIEEKPKPVNWNDPVPEPSEHLIHIKELIRVGNMIEIYDYLHEKAVEMLLSPNDLERQFVQKYVNGIEEDEEEEVEEEVKSPMDLFLEQFEED